MLAERAVGLDFELVVLDLAAGLAVDLLEADFDWVDLLADVFEDFFAGDVAILLPGALFAVSFFEDEEADLPAVALPVAFEGCVVDLVFPVLFIVACDLIPEILLPLVFVDLALVVAFLVGDFVAADFVCDFVFDLLLVWLVLGAMGLILSRVVFKKQAGEIKPKTVLALPG